MQPRICSQREPTLRCTAKGKAWGPNYSSHGRLLRGSSAAAAAAAEEDGEGLGRSALELPGLDPGAIFVPCAVEEEEGIK